MNEMIKMTALINSARTIAARTLIALGLTGVMAVPGVAASVGNTAPQSVQARNNQTQTGQNRTNQPQLQRQPGQNATELKVSYYTADPGKGGKIITTLTLTRPARPQGQTGNQRTVPAPGKTQAQTSNQAQGSQSQGSQPRPVNPVVAQAPAGARFAVIQGGRGGERVIDLSKADQMRGPGMGGPGMNERSGRDGGPRGPGSDQNNPNQNNQSQNDKASPRN